VYAGIIVGQTLFGHGDNPAGWASTIVVLLLVSGAILLSLGLIAEYLGVALHVLVGKPLYVTVDSPTPRPDAAAAAAAVTTTALAPAPTAEPGPDPALREMFRSASGGRLPGAN
jgi:undecaprenyl-phosphate 4-deoxy-4-formamido-L-arabinose transferase